MISRAHRRVPNSVEENVPFSADVDTIYIVETGRIAIDKGRYQELFVGDEDFRRSNMDHSPEHRIRRLALSFPTLRDAYGGVKPWDAAQLDRFACEPVADGAHHSARFVLAVWNAAFLDWAKNPWWA
jgi:hypothetical protein